MATIKYEIRIPTTQYGYINILTEGMELEEVIEQHNLAVKLYELSKKDNPGLSVKDFAKYKRDIMNGGYQLEDDEKASSAQKWWRHETEKTIQQLKNEQ